MSSPRAITLDLKDVTLSYPNNLYQAQSWRDRFVRLASPSNTRASVQETSILKNLSFTIYEGDRVGLLGRNGVGKSTLCKILCGMITPSSGSIEIKMKPRGIFVTQGFLFPELTGFENARVLIDLIFPLHSEKKQVLAEAIEFSELNSLIHMPVKSYSTGMESRLLLSILSAQRSESMVFDEVSESADQFFREKIGRRFVDLINKSMSSVIVSHDASWIERVCNRLIILKNGQIEYDGEVNLGLKSYHQTYMNENRMSGPQ